MASIVVPVFFALMIGLAVWHHIHGPRFDATAVPRSTPSLAECEDFPFMGHPAEAKNECPWAIKDQDPWRHLVVRNVGGRGDFIIGCHLVVRDAQGNLIWQHARGTTFSLPNRNGPGGTTTDEGHGTYLNAGASLTYDLPLSLPNPHEQHYAASYPGCRARCHHPGRVTSTTLSSPIEKCQASPEARHGPVPATHLGQTRES